MKKIKTQLYEFLEITIDGKYLPTDNLSKEHMDKYEEYIKKAYIQMREDAYEDKFSWIFDNYHEDLVYDKKTKKFFVILEVTTEDYNDMIYYMKKNKEDKNNWRIYDKYKYEIKL